MRKEMNRMKFWVLTDTYEGFITADNAGDIYDSFSNEKIHTIKAMGEYEESEPSWHTLKKKDPEEEDVEPWCDTCKAYHDPDSCYDNWKPSSRRSQNIGACIALGFIACVIGVTALLLHAI